MAVLHGRLIVIAVVAASIVILPGLGEKFSIASFGYFDGYLKSLPEATAVSNIIMLMLPAVLGIGYTVFPTKWTVRLWAAFLIGAGPVNLIAVCSLNLEGRRFAANELLRFVDQCIALSLGINTAATDEINVAAVDILVAAHIGLIHSLVDRPLCWKVVVAAMMSVGVICTFFGYWMLVPMDGPPPTMKLMQVSLIAWVAPFAAGFLVGHLATMLVKPPASKIANVAVAHSVHTVVMPLAAFHVAQAVVVQPQPPPLIPGAAVQPHVVNQAGVVADLNEWLPASSDDEDEG